MCPTLVTESYLHAFYDCPNNKGAGSALTRALEGVVGGRVSGELSLLLQLEPGAGEGGPDRRLAAAYVLAGGLKIIWDYRLKGKRLEEAGMKAELTARANVMEDAGRRRVADIIRSSCQDLSCSPAPPAASGAAP